ncbi:twin-arginine translocation signal domain-containing protein, partial [Novosphingobium rosa]|uniref:twin-arginine translocation signal domain-containing protein n=1 Tax=Novosphingobium rosa TaxID=76978 RepID=UPI0012EE09AB
MMDQATLRRRDFIAGAGALAGMALAGSARGSDGLPMGAPPRRADGRPMNMILYFTDECRADALACYGNP